MDNFAYNIDSDVMKILIHSLLFNGGQVLFVEHKRKQY